ncbi:TraB/GumN family protein [Clostridium sp. D2Q-14]|uniref:TraB/GumN family protein n=1 Tax=Anaeromonas gelatinilytica TaxID=2683194 RepID=UPI00193C7BB5|nr:TraB/GumN family protein [Anaeromonas gelatinilytica]MBS4534883.1 TraB/GumN family protein [Anaeromonas gelatinilytica]
MSEENITRLNINDKEIILIGTAHISQKSAEQVKEIIEEEKPDTVCIELDEQRYKSMTEGKKWQETDIISVIKQKKATLLLANLMMSSFQKRMAKQFNITPGQEMIQAINSAKEIDAELVMADRDIQITFQRIWRGISLWGKMKLITELIYSMFADEEISEDELEKLKNDDILITMLDELKDSFPELKKTLIDERDKYLSHKIKNAQGNKIVAVLGAGHIPGIKEEIKEEQNIKKLSSLPQKSKKTKGIQWVIPAIIMGIILFTFYNNRDMALSQAIGWILWNGSLSAIGAVIALAHPLSIVTAFLVAPISSLNPLLAAGWFVGIVETFLRKPKVEDFENLAGDINSIKGFWKNKITHILLVVVLANIGSVVGTAVGGAEVLRIFLKLF